MTAPSATPRATRRTGTRALALAAAVATAAVGAAVLVLPAHAAQGGAAPKLEITDGTLEWGVKEGFRKYVTGPIAHGAIEVADGARQADGNGPFTFTGGKGTYDTSTHAVATTFKGSVRFTGHGGELDLKLSDLKVRTEGTKGAITADVTASGRTTDDVALASLDLTGLKPGAGEGGAVTFAKIPAALTADGAKAFNGMYEEGQELDPATLTVKAGRPATTPATTPPQSPPQTATRTPSQPPTRTPTATPTQGKPTGDPTASPTSPASPSGRPSQDGTVADGSLDWGVKKSFRDYVTGPIAHGKITVSGGAKKTDGGFRFLGGQGTYDEKSRTLNAAFDGTVRFTGHGGDLDLKFSDLKVRGKGAKGSLVADVSAKDRGTGKVTESDDLTVAELKLPASYGPKGGVVTLTKAPATLTKDGAKAFGGFYHSGDALDPVTVSVSLDEDAALPGGGGSDTSVNSGSGSGGVVGGGSTGGTGSLAATGAGVPSATLLGGAGLLAAGGAAAVFATRRRTCH
ncbi:HtaA domain-containing protein [Streptomyces sp. XD-27]|uniref:HtaA domain-containing protein n=1 Tax=Streptomyces sp. XD-27 TaxID=3062779 RepID=UPI0026F469E3|nr:HtaA domain-containing protein [Streptomyces sp. XD-27]WKX70006.1 HtaA domain-containing protein [Streptomyces sp. XD-27]